MGWLGWAPEVVLATDINLIEMALSSRVDLINIVFGAGKKPKNKKGRVTATAFKNFVKTHNARRK